MRQHEATRGNMRQHAVVERFGSDDDCDGELSDAGSIDLMAGDFALEPVRFSRT